jgi:hypothetical protein
MSLDVAGTADPAVRAEFTSLRSQVLNPSPELRNC